MKVLVMGGCGKVGRAVACLSAQAHGIPLILDKSCPAPEKQKVDFLHVCIPFSKSFVRAVKGVMKSYPPKYVIVHSTVPVGTTRKLGDSAAHSPIRGQHDELTDSTKRFVKYVGGNTAKTGKKCKEHLESMGLDVSLWDVSEETELMKLLCLSRLLNDLAYYETADGICKRYGVPPERLQEWTATYNDGYKDAKKGYFSRPELTFPNGVAGGTCVLPVSKMLFEQTNNDWLKRNIATFEPEICKSK